MFLGIYQVGYAMITIPEPPTANSSIPPPDPPPPVFHQLLLQHLEDGEPKR